MMVRAWLGLVLVVGLLAGLTRADDPAPVALGDLADYRAALVGPLDPATARLVTFRDLWEHPGDHQGHPVRVEGRLARLFRQPGVGQFPPLAEAWITSPRGEPICVVFPTGPGQAAPSPGDQVRFAGTFLRRISYQGGDTKRVAPLVVGPGVPSVVASGSESGVEPFGPIFGGDHAVDWAIGIAASLGVLAVLLRRHLSRPAPGPAPIGPAPAFLDGDSPASEPGDDHDDDE